MFLSFNNLFLLGQVDLQTESGRLKYITDMPYICEGNIGSPGCGESAFWDIVKEKETAIPILIELLDDTTTTKATVANFGGNWTVADIAYSALKEIIKGIPTFELLGNRFDSDGCGYCSYWNYLREDYKNRQSFKQNIGNWYAQNKMKLVWIQSDETLTCDCRFKHPNAGHYEIQ
jgi:hypothetical protein